MCNSRVLCETKKRDRTSQQAFICRKVCFPRNKILHVREYINHNKVTGGLTDKQRGRDRFDGTFYSPTCSEKAETYRVIKGASIVVSAGLGVCREIVTLCVRGCSVNNSARLLPQSVGGGTVGT